MKIKINNELLQIIKRILNENKTISEWCKIESNNMFQSKHFNGEFDATEEEFCFSYFDENNEEWWFQFSLTDAKLISEEKINYLKLKKADK